MAFDFLGSIPSFEHFEEFEEFIKIEAANLDSRIATLTAEIKRHSSLADKYLAADSQLRAEYTKSMRPDRLWLQSPRPMQVRPVLAFDAANAVDVEILKKNFLGAIKQKRERNEYRVKRLRDLEFQIQQEINSLTSIKEEYQKYLDIIRARFDIDDFKSNQRTKPQDPAEILPGLTENPVDQGILVENGVTYYLVTAINAEFNSISFDGQAPPIKPGVKIVLSNGKNNGTKTVMNIKNNRTVVVFESVVTENNSKTKVTI